MLLSPRAVARQGGMGCRCCRRDTVARTRRQVRRQERQAVAREVREFLAR